jgi:hypothetical protein
LLCGTTDYGTITALDGIICCGGKSDVGTVYGTAVGMNVTTYGGIDVGNDDLGITTLVVDGK